VARLSFDPSFTTRVIIFSDGFLTEFLQRVLLGHFLFFVELHLEKLFKSLCVHLQRSFLSFFFLSGVFNLEGPFQIDDFQRTVLGTFNFFRRLPVLLVLDILLLFFLGEHCP